MQRYKSTKPIHGFRIFAALALLVACIWFIWHNSMLSPEDSDRRSQMAAEFLTRVFRTFLHEDSALIKLMVRNVRKIAHAVEFFALGTISIIILMILGRVNVHMVLHAVLLLLAVAVTDESIQLFSQRGAQVSDIILDFISGMTGLSALLFVRGIGAALRSD